MKPDAKLARQISQKLRLSRGIGVFTISSGGRGVSVYLTSFYASGPPVVKLDPILFGVSIRDIFCVNQPYETHMFFDMLSKRKTAVWPFFPVKGV